MLYRLHIASELTHRLYDILKYGESVRLNALCVIQLLNKFLEVLRSLTEYPLIIGLPITRKMWFARSKKQSFN
jgi:hypothetical protein